MARFCSYDEEISHLRNLLNSVSSDEKSIEEDKDFSHN